MTKSTGKKDKPTTTSDEKVKKVRRRKAEQPEIKQDESEATEPQDNNKTFAISQVNISFIPEEDRLLFAMNTHGDEQFRMYFTRRWIKLFWPQLTKVLEHEPTIVSYDNQARNAAMAFQHEAAMADADFNQPFSTENKTYPWGELPLVATEVRLRTPPNDLPSIGIYTASGVGLEFNCGHKILHYFYKVLPQAVQRADWDLALSSSQDGLPEDFKSSGRLN